MDESHTTGRTVRAEILSPGVLAGTLCPFQDARETTRGQDADVVQDPEAEIERFERSVATIVLELDKIASSLRQTSFDAEAAIVQAHSYLLNDPQFHQGVHHQIRDKGLTAQEAADRVLGQVAATLGQSENWLSERAVDFRDILGRLEARLSEREGTFIESVEHVYCPIITMRELLPSFVLEARRLRKCAFVVEKGTATSHAAILAKSFGFPVVRVERLGQLHARPGEDVLVDAIRGCVVPDPSDAQIDEMLEAIRTPPAPSRPSSLARLWMSITDPEQVTPETLLRVEGVGLYRTEVLFMASKGDFPSEDEQYQVYRRLFRTCGRTPVTFRTVDIGGDKRLRYFSLGPQENPYLGLRAHRIYRFHPEIFVTQMRAVLRAARGEARLRILYPMIESIEELRFVQSLLTQATDSLRDRGQEYQEEFSQGIMVEVPSAAWEFDALLQRVDFASVGTNDLLQYFLAADRNNANIAASYRPQSPAFLRMLRSLVVTAERQGKPLSICGEMASSQSLFPLLVAIGFKDISVDAHILNQAERLLGELDDAQCEQLADACLHCRTSEEVRVILKEFGYDEAATRWTPATAKDEAVDPVCKMVVHTSQNSHTADRHGRQYYFCSARCEDEFLSWQEDDNGHE